MSLSAITLKEKQKEPVATAYLNTAKPLRKETKNNNSLSSSLNPLCTKDLDTMEVAPGTLKFLSKIQFSQP
jgi:hypothetical protein